MPARWCIEPHIRTRRLGRKALAYHIGSGDTHLLSPLSGDILEVLSERTEARGCCVSDILAGRSWDTTEDQLVDALTMLAEAGIVRADPGQ